MNEIHQNWKSGETLYACRFQPNANVFLADGASDEAWGTGDRDADDYDVAMIESGGSGHYVGNFDSVSNIAAGVYDVCVYVQDGANPADGDFRLGQGTIVWDGSAEVNISTVEAAIISAQNDLDLLTGADGVTLASAQENYAPNKVVPDVVGTAAGLHTLTDGKIDVVDAIALAIKAKADNLPVDPADQSAVEAAIAAAHIITDGKIGDISVNIEHDSTLVTVGHDTTLSDQVEIADVDRIAQIGRESEVTIQGDIERSSSATGG